MRIGDLIRRSVVAVRPDQTLAEAASIMNSAGVGALVVVDGDRLAGIVTDRDLVRGGLARSLDPGTPVESVMTTGVVTVDADHDAHELYAVLRSHALRRLPVMHDAKLIGMISVDDLIIHLAADLSDLARPITGEVLFAQRDMAPGRV